MILELSYDIALARRQYARVNPIQANLITYRASRALVVARYHHGADAKLRQLFYSLTAVILDGIGSGNNAEQSAASDKQHRGLALGRELFEYGTRIRVYLGLTRDKAE